MRAKTKKKYTRALIGIVVVAIVPILFVLLFNTNNYVAMISSQRITKDEYMFFLSSTVANYEYAANVTGETRDDYWNSPNADRRGMAKKQALDTARDFKLQLIQAKENNISLDKNDLQKIETDFFIKVSYTI